MTHNKHDLSKSMRLDIDSCIEKYLLVIWGTVLCGLFVGVFGSIIHNNILLYFSAGCVLVGCSVYICAFIGLGIQVCCCCCSTVQVQVQEEEQTSMLETIPSEEP
jgi:hypothetical protein